MQDPASIDELRSAMLTRMGIATWQLRRPLQGATAAAEQAPAQVEAAPAADGRLWLQAESLPAPQLLADICATLGLNAGEVSLVPPGPLPPGSPEWLWLCEPSNDHPAALVCPLHPTPQQKRALWQQIRSRHA